ncbi:MAG: hypothetical protein KA988_06685 [Longilinea sp.]|nr:hypothetical protein [Longilinea sp.]
MKTQWIRFASCLLAMLLVCNAVQAVQAQAAIEILHNSLQVDYPDRLTFALQARSDSPIASVTLFYSTNASTCQTNQVRKPISITAGNQIEAEWQIELSRFSSLPPGAVLSWQWEIIDQSGNRLLSEAQTQTVQDQRYQWKRLQANGVAVQWIEGDTKFGQALLSTAVSSLERLAGEAGIPRPQNVLIVAYPSAEGVRDALHYLPEWTGGVAVVEYNIILVGIAPGQDDWMAEVVPHELGHLVTGERVFNCKGGSMPTWLSEGLSVYAEGPTSLSDQKLVENALRNQSLDSLESLANGFPANPQRASLAYAQSGMVVHFMIKEYGPQKMDALLGELKQGRKIDDALQTVYGLDTYELNRRWLASMGYTISERTRSSATPIGGAATRTPIPTLALWTQAYGSPATATPTPTPDGATPLPPTQAESSLTQPPATIAATPTSLRPTPATPSMVPLSCLVGLGIVFVVFLLGASIFFLVRRNSPRKE